MIEKVNLKDLIEFHNKEHAEHFYMQIYSRDEMLDMLEIEDMSEISYGRYDTRGYNSFDSFNPDSEYFMRQNFVDIISMDEEDVMCQTKSSQKKYSKSKNVIELSETRHTVVTLFYEIKVLKELAEKAIKEMAGVDVKISVYYNLYKCNGHYYFRIDNKEKLNKEEIRKLDKYGYYSESKEELTESLFSEIFYGRGYGGGFSEELVGDTISDYSIVPIYMNLANYKRFLND